MNLQTNTSSCVVPKGSVTGDLKIVGSVHVHGKTASVEASQDVFVYGVVEGHIKAKDAYIFGVVMGNIQAQRISFGPEARVYGELFAKTISHPKKQKLSSVVANRSDANGN